MCSSDLGLYPELAALAETINDYGVNQEKNSELAKAYGAKIVEQATKLGITKDLGLKLKSADDLNDAAVHEIEEHLIELKSANIPYGLHALGRVPEKEMLDSTVSAIVSADRSLLPSKIQVAKNDMEQRIVDSGARELDSMTRALDRKSTRLNSSH